MSLPIVLGITGGSGAAYGLRLLEVLLAGGHTVYLSISESGFQVLQQETGFASDAKSFDPNSLFEQRPAWWAKESVEKATQAISSLRYFHYRNFMSPMASGSALTAGMVICPCSGSTLSGIAHASSNNLIVRAADVHLKERRKLILVPRETPLSTLQIENYLRVSQAGAIVLPAMPGWYHRVDTPMDLVDFVVARIMDQLGLPQQLIHRWGGT